VIKNPIGRAYVGQANFAHNQQINNQAEPSRTREKEKRPDELLGDKDDDADEWLDTGAPQEAVGADSNVETVGEIDGAKVA